MRKHVGGTPHLWIILTDPDPNGLVAMVNITTPKEGSDRTVVLHAREHPRVSHESVIFFPDARLAPADSIRVGVEANYFELCAPVSPALLARIKNGLLESPFTPVKVVNYCRQIWGKGPA